jgi:hypothetical protein
MKMKDGWDLFKETSEHDWDLWKETSEQDGDMLEPMLNVVNFEQNRVDKIMYI